MSGAFVLVAVEGAPGVHAAIPGQDHAFCTGRVAGPADGELTCNVCRVSSARYSDRAASQAEWVSRRR